MKLFNYLLAGILCASVTCLPAQHRADPQKLVNPESFSMILLGDPPVSYTHLTLPTT